MEKKVYMAPIVEEIKVEIENLLQTISKGGGDPTIHNDPVDPDAPVILD